MAVASVVDEIPVTGLTFTCGRARCLMVGAGAVVAHHAVSHDNETALTAFFVATQAGVIVVDETIAIHVREGRKIVWARVRKGQATPRNWRAIQQMVAVRKSTAMTNTAVSLCGRRKCDVRHADCLVDRWGGHVRPACIYKKQRRAADDN